MRPVKVLDDSNLVSFETEYDAFGNLIKAWGPGDSAASPTIEIVYNYLDSQAPSCVVTKVKEGTDGGYLEGYTYYDGFRRVIQTKIEAEGVNQWTTVDTYYDSLGRVYKKSVPYSWNGTIDNSITSRDTTQNYILTEYDPLGRRIRITKPDGTFVDNVYEIIAGKLNITKIDETGHITTQELADNGRTKYTYEYTGLYSNPTLYAHTTTIMAVDGAKSIDNDGNEIITNLDMLGRKISTQDPDMGLWRFSYDANGNITSQTDANNQTIVFKYDKLNRLIEKHYPGGAVTYFHYDESGHGYSIGRLTRAIYDAGSISQDYDAYGRVVSRTVTIDGIAKTMSYTYDSLGRIETVTYPDGEVVTYTYNAGGFLETMTGIDSYVTDINYDPLGQLTDMVYGNGVTTNFDYYDSASESDPSAGTQFSYRLRGIYTNSATASIYNVEYAYDKNGNIVRKTDLDNADYSESYAYDDLDRLISAESMGYGPSNADGGNYTYGGKPHAVTQKAAVSYTYDANGNMISGNGKTYVYNYDNMLIAESGGSSYSYFDLTRVKKVENGVTTRYFFPEYQEEDNGVTVNQIKYYAGIARRSTDEGLVYFHKDHLGSTVRLTDINGDVVKTIGYRPYGDIAYETGTASLKYKFTGQEYDAGSGLYYYNARYYDPKLTRFTTADPLIPDSNPQSLNRYTYCLNNPVKYIDPTGNDFYDANMNVYYSEINNWLLFNYISGYGDTVYIYNAMGDSALSYTDPY
jgi:RHS repeat-associated protein